MKSFDCERMLRLDGKVPTIREKWTAFYRLYRAAKRNDPYMNGIDCLRVLTGAYAWIRLCNDGGDILEIQRFIPRVVRQQMVKTSKQRRHENHLRDLIHAIMDYQEDDQE